MKINVVLSSPSKSQIFDALFGYLREFAPSSAQIVTSISPIADADIYHYHRPHLEKTLKKPAIVTVHHDLNDIDSWFDLNLFLPLYHQADLIICLNSTQEKTLHSHGLTKTIVIPHAVNRRFLVPCPFRPYDPQQRPLILGMASKRYGRRVKGESYLYELLKRLPNDRLRLILTGEGRSLDLPHLKHQLGHRIDVYEYLPYRLMQSFYQEIDFLLMLSFYEGGPANIPEALGTGTPIIATPVGMAKDMIVDKKNGLILTGNIQQDTKAIKELIENKNDVTNQLITETLSEASHVPSWKDNTLSHFNVYRQLLENRQ